MKAAAPSGLRRAAQRGLSLVEVMVGLVIALLVGLAASATSLSFLIQQRQAMGAGGVSINSATVMNTVRDDVALAGLGFFANDRFLCHRMNMALGGVTRMNEQVFVPVQITRQAEGDVIDVIYGTRVEAGAAVRTAASSAGDDVRLQSLMPAAAGDGVLLAPDVPGGAATPCVVRTVTGVTPATANSKQLLAFDAASAPPSSYNGGTFANAMVFPINAHATMVGQLRWNRYRINNGQLIVERPLIGDSAVLARDVVSFRAQYGISEPPAGATGITPTLSAWQDPTGTWASMTPTLMRQLRGIRIGLIVRSPTIERMKNGAACDATAVRPTVFGLPAENTANADWACYRYRTATAVVPMRNLVMGQRL